MYYFIVLFVSNSEGVRLFLCIFMVKETEMALVGSSTKLSLNLCCPNGISRENDIIFFIFTLLFGASKR